MAEIGADNHVTAKRIGLGLGFFSIGLGLVEMAAPGRIARWLGVDNDSAKTTIRAFGAREIAAGLGVLAWPRSPVPMLARAAGDVLDIGAAGVAARKEGDDKRTTALVSLATVVGFLALDLLVARAVSRS